MEKKISVLAPVSVPRDKSAAPPWAGGLRGSRAPGHAYRLTARLDKFDPTRVVPYGILSFFPPILCGLFRKY